MPRTLRLRVLALALAAIGSIAGVAVADKSGPSPKEHPAASGDAKRGHDEGERKGREGERGAPAASSAAPASPSASASIPVDDDKADAARAAKRKEKRDDRKAKAKDARAALKKQVQGMLAGKPMAAALKEELTRNARRLARLDRAKELAVEANDAETAARVDKLLAKETARHERFMADFGKSGGAK